MYGFCRTVEYTQPGGDSVWEIWGYGRDEEFKGKYKLGSTLQGALVFLFLVNGPTLAQKRRHVRVGITALKLRDFHDVHLQKGNAAWLDAAEIF